MYLLEILCRTISVALHLLSLCYLLRVLWDLLFMGEESGFSAFLVGVTEPFVFPFRVLFDRMGWFQDIPLDVPFFASCLFVSITASVL